MIDWLKLRVPVIVHGQLPCDRVMVVAPTGEVKWEKLRSLEVVGSHSANLHISSCPITMRLVIDGNPTKFFQGHNVFGSDDIHGLAQAVIAHVCKLLAIELPEGVMPIEVARVDLTSMYGVGNLANAVSAVRAMGERATMRHRGRGNISGEGTAYWGKNSRRSSIKVYAKGKELRDHRLPKALPHLDEITTWATDKLRVEVVLRGMELKARGLDVLANWGDDTGAALFAEFVAKLNVPDNIELNPASIEALPPRLRLAYDSWMRGTDLRASLPRMTFYRYRKALLDHGVDILTVRPSAPTSNVLPLIRILEARPAAVPTWAIGTPAYFEPRRIA